MEKEQADVAPRALETGQPGREQVDAEKENDRSDTRERDASREEKYPCVEDAAVRFENAMGGLENCSVCHKEQKRNQHSNGQGRRGNCGKRGAQETLPAHSYKKGTSDRSERIAMLVPLHSVRCSIVVALQEVFVTMAPVDYNEVEKNILELPCNP